MTPPPHPGLTLPNWLDTAARAHPEKFALEFGSASWRFRDVHRAAGHAAERLRQSHAHQGGRIGILSANRPGVVFAVHAATTLTIPFVLLNVRHTAGEIAWQLQDADVTTLVVDESHADRAFEACAGRAVAIVPIEDLERDCTHAPPSRPHGNRGGPHQVRRIPLDREAGLLYTSGTSGRPKGVRITYSNLWFSAVASALHLGHRATDAWLVAMPLFHIGGLAILFRAVINATPVLLHARFDPAAALAAIDSGATLASVVPAMLQRMVELRGETPWPSTLRCILVGGSATPSSLIAECLRLGIPVAPTYGLTEATSQVTTLLPREAAAKSGSSGLLLPLTEVRIAAAGGVARSGEIGEIEVRGPTVFAGYLGQTNGRADPSADGWFRTGDAGYLDDDGYLYVVDRRDDLIVSGGENIYPAEIERVLRDHPRVADAGVLGVADASWGARPMAAIVWTGDPATANTELRRYCAERLSRYKIPDRFLLVPALPRSPSGKLLRRVMRETLHNADRTPDN